MATEVATMEIRHGKEDGSVKVFQPGETVSGLSEKELADLRIAGAIVVKQKPAEEGPSAEELQAEIDELRLKLAEATGVNGTKAATPGNAALKLQTETNKAEGRETSEPKK